MGKCRLLPFFAGKSECQSYGLDVWCGCGRDHCKSRLDFYNRGAHSNSMSTVQMHVEFLQLLLEFPNTFVFRCDCTDYNDLHKLLTTHMVQGNLLANKEKYTIIGYAFTMKEACCPKNFLRSTKTRSETVRMNPHCVVPAFYWQSNSLSLSLVKMEVV